MRDTCLSSGNCGIGTAGLRVPARTSEGRRGSRGSPLRRPPAPRRAAGLPPAARRSWQAPPASRAQRHPPRLCGGGCRGTAPGSASTRIRAEPPRICLHAGNDHSRHEVPGVPRHFPGKPALVPGRVGRPGTAATSGGAITRRTGGAGARNAGRCQETQAVTGCAGRRSARLAGAGNGPRPMGGRGLDAGTPPGGCGPAGHDRQLPAGRCQSWRQAESPAVPAWRRCGYAVTGVLPGGVRG